MALRFELENLSRSINEGLRGQGKKPKIPDTYELYELRIFENDPELVAVGPLCVGILRLGIDPETGRCRVDSSCSLSVVPHITIDELFYALSCSTLPQEVLAIVMSMKTSAMHIGETSLPDLLRFAFPQNDHERREYERIATSPKGKAWVKESLLLAFDQMARCSLEPM